MIRPDDIIETHEHAGDFKQQKKIGGRVIHGLIDLSACAKSAKIANRESEP
jgi:hypothetical protein